MEVVEKDAASIAAAIAAALRNLAAKNKNVFAQQRLNSVPSSKSAPLPLPLTPSLLSVWLARPSFRKMGEAWKLLAWAQWTDSSFQF